MLLDPEAACFIARENVRETAAAKIAIPRTFFSVLSSVRPISEMNGAKPPLEPIHCLVIKKSGADFLLEFRCRFSIPFAKTKVRINLAKQANSLFAIEVSQKLLYF